MGRIHEALRRAGAVRPSAAAAPEPATDASGSPWAFGEREAERREAERDDRRRWPEAAATLPAKPAELQPAVLGPSLEHRFDPTWRERLAVGDHVEPALVHQFRRLAASLLHYQRNGRLKVIMVTSAVPGDGKTLTALNLAVILSESYRHRVLLIDADLRRPAISQAANLAITDGLSEALKAPDDRKVSVVQLSEKLTLLPAGRPDPDPLSGISSPRMQRLLEDAAAGFDWVILDAPPVSAVADASLLSSIVDGVLLVIRAGKTGHAAARQAIDTLGADRILGVVLNGAENVEADGDVDYYNRPGLVKG